jgi:competence protein ComEA
MQHEKLLKISMLTLVLTLILMISINGNRKNAQWVNVDKKTVRTEKITVHIAGAITCPGVYKIPQSYRFKDVLKDAGGVLDEANMDKINLAIYPKDGQRLYIPYKKKNKKSRTKAVIKKTPVSINTASMTQLETIPYIGKKTASRIIDYRLKNRAFRTTKELTKIEGIGEKTYLKIKDWIRL